MTASQDMYVKFIDVTNPRNIVSMPKAKDPVFRARYTVGVGPVYWLMSARYTVRRHGTRYVCVTHL